METNRFIFRAFRAPNDIEACMKYKEGHQAVLRDYGITNITSNMDEWMHDPHMHCVVAYTHDHEMIGGIRVQVAEEGKMLPVEKAIGKMDNRIYDIVKNYREDGGVGELSALWNAKKVAGLGVSMLLVRAGISITNQAGIKTLVGICGEYTLKMFQQVGFVVNHSLGMNGLFAYPKDEFQARVLGILNSSTLETAAEYDKNRMQFLRENPVSTYTELGPKGEMEVDYNLVMAEYNEKKKYA